MTAFAVQDGNFVLTILLTDFMFSHENEAGSITNKPIARGICSYYEKIANISNWGKGRTIAWSQHAENSESIANRK